MIYWTRSEQKQRSCNCKIVNTFFSMQEYLDKAEHIFNQNAVFYSVMIPQQNHVKPFVWRK